MLTTNFKFARFTDVWEIVRENNSAIVIRKMKYAHSGTGTPMILATSLYTWGICTLRAGKLYRARSRLYRSQILQLNTHVKTLAEIYTKHSFALLSNLIFSKT